MTNKESKLKEKILIISIALILILMGLIIYIRYTNKEESKVVEEVNNYYTAEFLFNNDYIKIASTIEDFNKDTNNLYMYLDGNNILHIKYKNKESEINKTVEGLPKGEVTVYYSTLGNDCFEFGGLLENNFYYSNFCLNENEQPFEMISTNARTVYTPSIDKKEVHVINNAKITSNFIIDTETEEMKYLSYKDNVLYLNAAKPLNDLWRFFLRQTKLPSVHIFCLPHRRRLRQRKKYLTVLQASLKDVNRIEQTQPDGCRCNKDLCQAMKQFES